MLSKSQQRLLLALQKRKERETKRMCIIEGDKFVRDVRDLVEFSFTPRDTTIFREVVSTEAPQSIAAVARIPEWKMKDVTDRPIIIMLDGVQDPGNVGTIMRGCLGFDASLLLVECAEVTNPKTVRASASAALRVPYLTVSREEAPALAEKLQRPIYRLEKRQGAVIPEQVAGDKILLIAGSEGRGIRLEIAGTPVVIPHHPDLESLNVAVALGITLYEVCRISP